MISSNMHFQAKTFIGIGASALISCYCPPLSWAAYGAVSVAGQALVHGVGALVNRCRRSIPKRRITTDFNAVVAKIAELKKTKKVSLMIGRVPRESLPEPKDDTIWVSLDECDLEDSHTDVNRLHLTMNALDKSLISRLKGLFNEVVVDFSTWKFFAFNSDGNKVAIETLRELLDPTDPDATFISDFQFGGGCKSYNMERIAEDISVQRGLLEEISKRKMSGEGPISPEEAELIQEQIKKTNLRTNENLYITADRLFDFLPSVADENRMQVVNNIDMLRRLFSRVERVQGEPHPYPNRYRPAGATYYVLKGLRSTSS